MNIFRKCYRFLSSVRLTIFIMSSLLACSIVSVTLFTYDEAMRYIFTRAWFISLLVLLVINVAACFFPRIWRQRMTLTLFGMSLFHLSFVFMLLGVVYNSLLYFRANIRITEGETLQLSDLSSYETVEKGSFFDTSHLRGEITLKKMHANYNINGQNKFAAYEVEIGEGPFKKNDIIYVTHPHEYRGFRYYNDSEGYSVLVILYDRTGREIFGAHIPLQSLRQPDKSYLYTTGTRTSPGSLPFPQGQMEPLFGLQVMYTPSKLKERAGDVMYSLFPFSNNRIGDRPFARGGAQVGKIWDAGDYKLETREIRYWVRIHVRYDPGKPIVLTFLWVGLAGIVITTIGRIKRY